MSLDNARECFDENTKRINPEHDPVGWNLNNGLCMLASALDDQIQALQIEMRKLRQEMANLK